tara:strand:- start:543 stop:812 length:270 start_codon:yes stop_codon:yes gene_type:complete
MPCTPDYCDEHDFMVASGSAWCRMEFAKRANEGGRVAAEMGLSDAIYRMGDLVEELLEERKARFQRRRQPEPEAPTKRKPSEGGYQWSR